MVDWWREVREEWAMQCTAWHVGTRVRQEATLWRPRDRRMCQGNGFIGQNMELGCYRIVMLWREGILILDARGQAKIVHNCLPYWHCNSWTHPSAVSVFIRGQKPIFCCTDPPWRGATCPNKTNKSGGPKDVADAWLPPPSLTKMLSLSEWREWMGQWVGTGQGSRRGAATLTHSQYHVTDHTKLRSHDQSN